MQVKGGLRSGVKAVGIELFACEYAKVAVSHYTPFECFGDIDRRARQAHDAGYCHAPGCCMKTSFVLLRSLVLASGLGLGALPALACDTPGAAGSNAVSIARQVTLTTDTARQADLIFVGTVEKISQPRRSSPDEPMATLSVTETLKGEPQSTRTLPASGRFVLACDAADTFNNIDFGLGVQYLVYVRDGHAIRTAPLRKGDDDALSPARERELVVAAITP